ncbi:MAG: class C sortase [Oscillospiraceae bacterium]|nr:class C sortase [Oscillospiraceae bacterium]
MKRRISNFILLFIFFIGLSASLYPAIGNYWNSKTQTEAIIDYEKMLENMPEEDYTALFQSAEQYNKKLLNLDNPLTEYTKLSDYNDILDLDGTGMMGYITIEKIQAELPIYHGTSEAVLSKAAGHLEGSSFPIGEKGSHTVISAHRGMPTAVLFTYLDRLEVGDTFSVTILNRTTVYEVDQIRIVDPDDISELSLNRNEEYCTLITCTPYGINTQRLLVRGKSSETVLKKNIYISTEAYRIKPLIIMPVIAVPILFVLMMTVIFKPVRKKDTGEDI